MHSHKELALWQNAISLVTDIYMMTKQFPKEEIYGLTSQIRRSALSVPSNISEGAARNQSKEFIRFLYISMGSISELETQLIIDRNLKYISDFKFQDQENKIRKIRIQLAGLIKSIKNHPKKTS